MSWALELVSSFGAFSVLSCESKLPWKVSQLLYLQRLVKLPLFLGQESRVQ